MTNSFQFHQFTFADVAPSIAEIREFIQSDKLENNHPVNLFIDEILPHLEYNAGIRGGYIIKQVQSISPKEGTITIDGISLEVGKQVCSYIRGSEYLSLFLCTSGTLFEKLSEELNHKGDFMEAFIVDAIGSLTVEKAMDEIQKSLQQTLEQDKMKISNRYSPGYCNWHLSSQQLLFSLIGNNATGISLTESCLMLPIKSVSGIIGIGHDVKKRDYGCAICNNATCIYRKIVHK